MDDLHEACYMGNVEVVRRLLANGVDVNQIHTDGAGTPIASACSGRKLEVINVLFEYGANPNIYGDRDFWSPLEYACSIGNNEIVECLLLHGADPNTRDTLNYSPLNYADRGGHLGCVKLLLRHGAKIEIPAFPSSVLQFPVYRVMMEYFIRVSQFSALYTLFGQDVARDLRD